MKFILKFLIFSIVLSSCTDDNNPFDHTSKQKILLLKKVITEDEIYTRTSEYVYSDNKIITVNHVSFKKSSNSNYYSKDEYEYISENEYFKYYYSNDELRRKFRYFKPTPNTFRREELDVLTGKLKKYYIKEIDNSCGATNAYYYNSDNILTYKNETNYYDSNCSFNKLGYDSDGKYRNKYQDVRDNKRSPYITLYMSNFYKTSPENWHNTIESNHWDENNILTYSKKSTFEYNKEGYPTFAEQATFEKRFDGDINRSSTIYYEYY